MVRSLGLAWLAVGLSAGETSPTRERLLALPVPAEAHRVLWVVDLESSASLAALLEDKELLSWLQINQLRWPSGDEAERLAARFRFSALPALVLTDARGGALGVLERPADAAAVLELLRDPGSATQLVATEPVTACPQPMSGGHPTAWLIGGVHGGRAGESLLGVDAESLLRPSLGLPSIWLDMMTGGEDVWRSVSPEADGTTIITATRQSYGWSRGVGYAVVYVHASSDTSAWLHLQHSGIASSAWLDGCQVQLEADAQPPADFPRPGIPKRCEVEGLTTEGLRMTALPEEAETARQVRLDLAAGWHLLRLKLTMQHGAGELFRFTARFTDANGQPSLGLATALSDPLADQALAAVAARLRPRMHLSVPADLPRPGESLRIAYDLSWHPDVWLGREPVAPIPSVVGILRIVVADYDGTEIARREVPARLPGLVHIDFGQAPDPGWYAVRPSFHSVDGRQAWAWWPDGFSVVPGNTAQRERVGAKKLWNNFYYAKSSGDQGFGYDGAFLDWLERSGVLKNLGSWPGFAESDRPFWEAATRRGLILCGDSGCDSPALNAAAGEGERCLSEVARYAPMAKGVNEIDIRTASAWRAVRDPQHWVERTRREWQALHAARQDAVYLGGSLVRPGDWHQKPLDPGTPSPGSWFIACLGLGLDRWHDAWDIHAYPQRPPLFGGPLGNSPIEDERGVLAAYAAVGRTNSLPFWLGETGAKASHGADGRRWQAETTAKLIAWVNSRTDYHGLAFCIGHEYDWGYGRVWDYSMGHKPGEAAMITAGALIDGLPYTAIESGDPAIQIGSFGPTLMAWASDGEREWSTRLPGVGPWLQVDVVGRVREVHPQADGLLSMRLGTSPIYLIPAAEFARLTR